MHLAVLRTLITRVLSQFSAPHIVPIALLIDGDQVAPDMMTPLLAEAGKFGGVTIRRVYGNWAAPTMQRWRPVALHYGCEQRHQEQTASGKNAADIALVVDAMDLFANRRIMHFCLANSDSDFTPLIRYLRSAGCFVACIGTMSAPPSLVKACTVFVTFEQLLPATAKGKSMEQPSILSTSQSVTSPMLKTDERVDGESSVATLKPAREIVSSPVSVPHAPVAFTQTDQKAASSPLLLDVLTSLLLTAYKQTPKEGEWLSAARFGSTVKQLDPKFSAKIYGYKDIPTMLKAQTHLFETRKQSGKGGHIEVRLRHSGA